MQSQWLSGWFNAFRRRSRGKRAVASLEIAIEHLEERALLSAVSWISDTNGFWDEASNWSDGEVPDGGDDVTIDRGAFNPIITIRDDRTVNSIISRESLVVSIGTFRINNTSQIDSSTTTLASGALIAAGPVTITSTGTLDWQGGGVFGNGLINSGTIEISADTDVRIGGQLANNGTIEHSGTGSLLFDGSTRLFNNLGAVYDFAGDGDIGQSGQGGGFGPSFENAGTIRKSGGTGTSAINALTLNNAATAAFDIDSGRFNAASSGDWAGFTADGSAAGVFEVSGFYNVTGTLSGSGSGHLELTGQINSVGSDAKLNFSAGYLQFTNGVMFGGNAGFNNQGFITISGPNDVRLAGQINNNGTIIHASDHSLLIDGSTRLNNNATGVFNFTADGDIGRSQFGGGFNPSIENAGTIRKSSGGDVSTISGIPLNNSATGVMDVLSGSMLVSGGGFWSGGTFNAAAGAKLQLASTIFIESTLTGAGAGRIEVIAGGGLATTANGATLNFPVGLFHWTAGSIGTNAPLNNIGTLQISGDSDKQVGARIINSGTVIHSGAGDIIDVAGGNGSRFDNLVGAVYEFQGNDGNVTFSTFNNAGTVRKTSGTGDSRFYASNGDPNGFIGFNNTGGTVSAETGTIRLARGRSTGGVFNASTGAVVDITGGAGADFEGIFTGSGGGRVEMAGGNVTSVGTGAVFNFPAGLFHWTGGSLGGGGSGFRNDGSITIDGTNGKGLSNNFTNNGTLINVGPGEFGLGGYAFTNSATGVFDQAGDSPLSGTDQFTNAGRFINAGLLKKSAGAGAVSWNTRLENTSTGVIEVSAGTLGFSRGGGSTGGTFHVSAGAILEFTGNDTFDWAGTFTGTGLGDIEFESLMRGNEGSTPGTLNFPEGMFHVLSGQLLGNIINQGWFELANPVGLFVRANITNNGTVIHSGAGDLVLNANTRFINNGLYDLRTDADLVVPGDASGGSMFFVNTPTGVFRKSGGLGTSSLRHDGNNKELRFDNSGTVEVQTGTVEFVDAVVQFSGATLSGGTWIARAFSTISAPNATNFTTNQGNVMLDGLGSSFARINALTTNNGSFTVTGGRDFTTAGNLANTGEITIGPASDLTVTGNLTETPFSHLAGWWRGDDDANDAAGSITGTLSGNTSFDEGEFGHGFSLDGNRDFVSLGNPTGLRLQDFTISAWVKRDTATTGLIFSYGQSGYGFGIGADGKLFLTTIGINQVSTTGLQITDSEFHHLAVTKSGTSVTFYMDGQTEIVAPFSTTFSFFSNAAIGGRADVGGGDLDGVIDEVAVFSRPLTTAEIQTLGEHNHPTAIGNQPPAINLEIADRPGTGQFGKLIVTGTANFNGALNVDLIGGFGPTIPDVYPVITYASRTGSFFPATGISPFFDIAINPTQTTLTVVASAADVSVDSVSVTPTASPGDSITVNYTIKNLDNINVAGSWFDSIYLSADGSYDPSDVLIGRVEHTGGLAPLASYAGQLTAQLAGVTDGTYRVIVIADSRGNIGDANRSNNARASSNPLAVTIPTLAFGTQTPLTISPNQDIYLKLNVPFGGDVQVTANFLNSLQAEFFVRQGALPTRSDFDFVASDLTDLSRTITVASPQAGPYYILFHGREGATGGVGFNVRADNIAFDVETVSPSKGSNRGTATTVLTGAGFTSATVVQLLNGSGTPIATATTRVISQNRLFATFNLVGVAAGTYAVRASQPGFSDTVAAAYEVVVGQPGDVRVEVVTPGSVRGGRIYTGYIDYQNVGDTDVVPPLIFVVSSSAVTFDLTKDPSVLEDRFLAVSPEGPAGILAPGQSVRIPFRFFGNNMSIEALTMSPDETAPMDWEALRSEIRPDNPPAGWDAMFNQQFVSAGTTVGDYVQLLADAATLYQTRNGTTTGDPDELHRFLMHEGFTERDTDIRGFVYRDTQNRLERGVTVIAIDETTGIGGSAVSTADGLVRIPNLPAGTYTITFDGFLPPANLQKVVVPANGSAPTQNWIVGTGGSIKGRIGVPDGTVIVDEDHNLQATVVATDAAGNRFTATVDEDHVYQFRGLPSGIYDLSFSSPTTLPVFANHIVVNEGFTTGLIDLFSPAGGSITGKVTRDGGIPVPGVRVQISNDPANPRTAITDASGQYRLNGVTPGQVTLSTNTAGGFQDVSLSNISVTAGQVTTGQNLVVDFNVGSLSGTITANGQPASQVQAILIDDIGNSVTFDVSAANGAYSLENIAPGTYTLQIQTFGYVPFSQEVTIDEDENVDLDVELTVAAIVTGEVRVTVPSGTLPAAFIPLTLTYPDGSALDLQADTSGQYGISNLGIGSYSLALADGSHRTEFEITSAGQERHVNITLTTGLIHGRILSSNGSPSSNLVTAYLRKDGRMLAAVSVEANGDFSFPIVANGTYDISFDSDVEFLAPISGVSVTAGSITNLGNIVSPAATLNLTINDTTTGLPITAEGLVFLQQLIGDDVYDTVLGLPISAGGLLNISGLAPGQYVVRPIYAGQSSPQVPVTIAAGSNSQQITLKAAGQVAGSVSDGVTPLEGITVTIYSPSSPQRYYQTITDAEGKYDLDLLPDGQYTVVFADLRADAGEGYLGFAQVAGVTVVAGQATAQNAVLTPGNATLKVSVTGNTQASPDSSTPTTTLATLTNADGIPIAVTVVVLSGDTAEQTLSGLPAGAYMLEGLAPGYTVGSKVVNLSAGANSQELSAIWLIPSGNAMPEVQVSSFASLSMRSFQSADPVYNLVLSANDAAANLKRLVEDLLGIFPERQHPFFKPPEIPHPPTHCPDLIPLWRAVGKAISVADNQLSGWEDRYSFFKSTLLLDATDIGVSLVNAALTFTSFVGNIPVLLDELSSLPVISRAGLGTIADLGQLDVIAGKVKDVGKVFKLIVDTLIGAAKDPTKADEQIPGVALVKASKDVVDVFYNLSEVDSIDEFFGLISKFSNFASKVGGFISDITAIADLIAAAKIPALLAAKPVIDKAAAALSVVATSMTAIGNTLANAESLNQNRILYEQAANNVLTKLNAYLAALENCDDEEKKTKLPRQPLTREDLKNLAIVVSSDPNDIVGPGGSGSPDHFMRVDQNFPYMVLFENKPEATAPAQEVVITQQLDADLDWSSFELGDFGFGDTIIDVPEGRNFYQTRVDLRETLGFFVDFTAGINLETGVVTWRFVSIDPETGDLVHDALAGFLPPNDGTGRGQGFVEYSINPDANLTTGATITAQASIVFDDNAPLLTPVYVNKIDTGVPGSSVTALAATQDFPSFLVSWSGIDDAAGPTGSGVVRYDVYVSDNGGPFVPFLLGTAQTSATFTGQISHTYSFYSVATDGVGFHQPDPGAGQTSTQVLDVLFDFGDAPDPFFSTPGKYPTLLSHDGPRHKIGSGLYLGSTVDREFDGQPNATATGDDLAGAPDDEDGVVIPGLIRGTTGSATVTASLAGKLDAWIDFNRDGDWDDPGEQIATSLSLAAGSNNITFAVPAGASTGTSFARFRLSSAGGLAVTGAANDGEVEDYQVQIGSPLVTNSGSATSFTKKQSPVVVAPLVAVPVSNLANGVLTISVNAVGTKKKSFDAFTFAGAAGLGTVSGGQFVEGRVTLVIQLSPTVTASAIQTFLRGITFSTTGKGLKIATRTVEVTLANSSGASSRVTQTINVIKKAPRG